MGPFNHLTYIAILVMFLPVIAGSHQIPDTSMDIESDANDTEEDAQEMHELEKEEACLHKPYIEERGERERESYLEVCDLQLLQVVQ